MDQEKPSPYPDNKQIYPNNPGVSSQTLKQLIQDEIKTQLASPLFTARKLTDTPTDTLQVVNRAYVTNNGTVRPTSSVKGQLFLDTTLASGRGKPIWWNGTGWIDATGTLL